jgi:hypothetical protein
MTWNVIESPYRGPHVYVICSIDVVYIGETQKHPAIRWADHLESGDGFRARIAEKGNPDLDYLSNLIMFARRCDWITTTFTAAQWKTATQAVEHSMHDVFAADPRVLGKHLRLISDTEKTAPRGFRSWSAVDDFVREILLELRHAFVAHAGSSGPA